MKKLVFAALLALFVAGCTTHRIPIPYDNEGEEQWQK